jgi:hypothetical protein
MDDGSRGTARPSSILDPPSFIGFRLAGKNTSSILLVFAPVYGVASTGTYPKYAPADDAM